MPKALHVILLEVPHLADAEKDRYSSLFKDVDVRTAWRSCVISKMQGPIYPGGLSVCKNELGLGRDVLVGDDVLHWFDCLGKTLDCMPAAHRSGTSVVKGLTNYVYDDDNSIKFPSGDLTRSETVCAAKSPETKEDLAAPKIIGSQKQDHWILDKKNKQLIRVHITPRKALFTPNGRGRRSRHPGRQLETYIPGE